MSISGGENGNAKVGIGSFFVSAKCNKSGFSNLAESFAFYWLFAVKIAITAISLISIDIGSKFPSVASLPIFLNSN